MTMRIRKLEKSDIDSVARIVAETELWQKYGLNFKKARVRFEKGLQRGADIYIAEIENEIVGFIWYVPDGAFDRSGYIELIGVGKNFRGKGVGQKLMKFVENLFSPESIFLLVSDFNEKAQKFYSHLGYKKVGEIEDYVVEGITEFIFYKKVR